MEDITLSNESIKRQEKVAGLRTALAELYEQREHMVTFEKPALVALYTDRIGRFQYEEFVLMVDVKRLKRKAQMMQACTNRGEKIDLQTIEIKLEKEFAEYQKMIEEQTENIRKATAYLESPMLTEEEVAELKSLYHVLVKRLHPDWNPDLSQKMKDLFVHAQAAYKMCDLQGLRNILLMLDPDDQKQNAEISIDEIAHLENAIEELRKRIAQMDETFPFTIREKINDEGWVKEQLEGTQARIEKLKEEKTVWELYVKSMENPNKAEA